MRSRLAGLSLLGKFSVLSLLAMALLGFGLAKVLAGQIEERALANAQDAADTMAHTAVKPLVTSQDLARGVNPFRLREFDRRLETDLGEETIDKVKIYNRSLKVVYSGDRSEVGTTAESDEHLLAARAGEVQSHVESDESHSGIGHELLEVYVPLRLEPGAKPAGVFEVYLPYAPTAAAIAHDTRTVYAILAAGFTLLYLLLFRIVASASGRLRRQADENRHQALHDALTGLPNRTLLYERLEELLGARRRPEGVDALMIIDLDRFKEVNDTLGHDHGDLLLKEVASRLSDTIRADDTLARLGGDEFAILSPGMRERGMVAELAVRLQEALERPFMLRGLSVELEASIGVAIHPDHGDDVTTLVQRADVAMYDAKRGRTRIATYSAERDPYTASRLALLGELRRAIENDELVLHYQPVIEMASGRVTGVEALVRWQHPQWGLIQPSDFVPLAERTGTIGSLTAWVVDRALRQARAWRDDGLDLTMSVNLAGPNVVDHQVNDAVADALERHGVAPERLVLEISETTVMADPKRAGEVLGRFRAMGVVLSLDDFGTGYSSLAYLKRLPLDQLKIDRSFVMSMTEDENDAVIVRSTIDLARNLGLAVVAEGVETREIRDRLVALRCENAQGFLYSRPVPPAELQARLAEDANLGGPALRAV